MFNRTKIRLSQLIREAYAHTGLKRYLANAGWMFLFRIINMGIAFVATAYVVRYLGPASYGELSYAISFVGLFGVLVSLGVDTVLYRDLVTHKEKKDVYLGTAFRIKLAAAVSTIGITGVVAYFFSNHDVSLYLILIISSTYIFNAFNVISYEFQADVNMKRLTFAAFYSSLFANALKVLVCIFDQGVLYLSLAIILEGLVMTMLSIHIRHRTYGSLRRWKFDWAIAKQMLSASWPLLFSSAFVVIYSRIDQVMIKNMIDSTSVGLYDAAARISELWYFLPALIVSTFFPAIVNARETSSQTYANRMARLAWSLIAISCIFALPIALFAKPIVLLIYGSEFLGSVSILQIYVWGGIGVSLVTLFNVIFLAEHNTKAVFFMALIAMSLNVVLNFIFIPRFGSVGAAWATFISYFAHLFSILLFKEGRQIFKIILGRKVEIGKMAADEPVITGDAL